MGVLRRYRGAAWAMARIFPREARLSSSFDDELWIWRALVAKSSHMRSEKQFLPITNGTN
jgi:hypothetical protein